MTANETMNPILMKLANDYVELESQMVDFVAFPEKDKLFDLRRRMVRSFGKNNTKKAIDQITQIRKLLII